MDISSYSHMIVALLHEYFQFLKDFIFLTFDPNRNICYFEHPNITLAPHLVHVLLTLRQLLTVDFQCGLNP